MRLVIQRVLSGAVHVENKCVGKIGRGCVVLVGIEQRDTNDDIEWASKKLLNLRLWPDDKKRPWQGSLSSNGYGLLLVSQFTLHGYLKGNRPDFHRSMEPKQASDYFDKFVRACQRHHADKVETGIFGAKMKVSIENDGPVTLILDSQEIGFKRRIPIPSLDEKTSSATASAPGSKKQTISKKERKRMAKKIAKLKHRIELEKQKISDGNSERESTLKALETQLEKAMIRAKNETTGEKLSPSEASPLSLPAEASTT